MTNPKEMKIHTSLTSHTDASLARPNDNTYWVQANRLLAGEYPGVRNEKESIQKLLRFLDLGVNAFLDLTEAHELLHYEMPLRTMAAKAGIDCVYRRMPIRDADVPHKPQLMKDILLQINTWIAENRNVYVHCWGGVGRTGTVVGCHLVQNGYSGAEARQRIKQLWTQMSADKQRRRPQSPETPAQHRYILDWNRVIEE